MGGSKLLDRPSNIHVMCSQTNGLIESHADWAALARIYGWKLNRWQEPEAEQIYDIPTGQWYLLDNNYQRLTAEKEAS